MKRVLTFFLLMGLHQYVWAEAEKETIVKPNIIIFYIDDLGWQDSQLNDIDAPTPWETPNMLALAQKGMNYTQAYSPAPTCAPSRAGILSGQHPAKLQLTHVLGADIPTTSNNNTLIPPYINDHFMPGTLTIAEALQANGYRTGHVGKWHLGQYANVGPLTEGFDYSYSGRGAHKNTKDRSKDFATHSKEDEFQLSDKKYPPFSDKHPQGISYPYDLVTEKALEFVQNSKDEPFFLYLAHWMVHYPTVTKNRALLEYYTDKLGIDFPKDSADITTTGQSNPYYGAMVTTVDWSLGRLVDMLEKTDDPRNKGKKLIDTTYIFMTSDNGGTENRYTEIITDNAPLDEGKKHLQEGGVRVPMVVRGPEIKNNSEFHGLINQLDYFPTILALTHTTIANEDASKLSGVNIANILKGKSNIVIDNSGKERENLFWHFPHYYDKIMQSSIRQGDFKLYKNYLDNSYSLYRLYQNHQRADLEERHDLAGKPEFAGVVRNLRDNLEVLLLENDATSPLQNPNYTGELENKHSVPKILSNNTRSVNHVTIKLDEKRNKAKQAYVLAQIVDRKLGQSKPGKEFITYQKVKATINENGYSVAANIPDGFSKYLFVIIDKNNFLVKSQMFDISNVE